MNTYTLKGLAESGYVMGLGTLEEVYHHMSSHYDAYFSIATLGKELYALETLLDGHWNDSIWLHITQDDAARMDAELDAVLDGGKGIEPQAGEDDSSADAASWVNASGII